MSPVRARSSTLCSFNLTVAQSFSTPVFSTTSARWPPGLTREAASSSVLTESHEMSMLGASRRANREPWFLGSAPVFSAVCVAGGANRESVPVARRISSLPAWGRMAGSEATVHPVTPHKLGVIESEDQRNVVRSHTKHRPFRRGSSGHAAGLLTSRCGEISSPSVHQYG